MSLLLYGAVALALGGYVLMRGEGDGEAKIVTLSNGETWTWDVQPAPSGSGFIALFARSQPGFAPIWRRAPNDPYPTEAAAVEAAKAQIALFDPTTPTPKIAAAGTQQSAPGFAFGNFQWGDLPVKWQVVLGADGLYTGQVYFEPFKEWGSAIPGQMEPRNVKLLLIELISTAGAQS